MRTGKIWERGGGLQLKEKNGTGFAWLLWVYQTIEIPLTYQSAKRKKIIHLKLCRSLLSVCVSKLGGGGPPLRLHNNDYSVNKIIALLVFSAMFLFCLFH